MWSWWTTELGCLWCSLFFYDVLSNFVVSGSSCSLWEGEDDQTLPLNLVKLCLFFSAVEVQLEDVQAVSRTTSGCCIISDQLVISDDRTST